jgi:glycosyltransferase involved in cell wall biosynthesis
MRVLFALESYLPRYGGEEIRVHNLAKRLPQSWDVHVVAPRFDNSPPIEDYGRVHVHRLGEFDSSSYFRNGDRPLFASLSYGAELRRFMAETSDFDIVQFGQWNMLHFLLSNGALRCPKIIDWCEVLSGQIEGIRGFGESMLERALAKRADHHIVVSPFAAAELSESHGVPTDEISVVQNGVSEDLLLEERPVKNRNVILYVGRIVPHKQVDLLLGAVKLLNEQGIDLDLHVVGEGPTSYVKSLRAKSAGFAAFLGTLPDQQLAQEYSDAGVLVLPSKREGSSLVSLEAMASWTPVITIDAPQNRSTRDVIKNEVNGLVVEDSAIGIANGLTRVLGDEGLYERLSKNAYETASGRTWSRMAEKLSLVFDSVVAGKAVFEAGIEAPQLPLRA